MITTYRIIYLLIFFLLESQLTYAQKDKSDTIITPFKIEAKYLSGLEIPKIKLKAHPNRIYFQKTLYKGSELSVFILSSETATNNIDNFPIDEFVYYINGKAFVKNNTQSKRFYSGDYLAVPKGFSGSWTNNGGEKYHLELSVITNKRSKNTRDELHKFPFALNKELLSGINITPKDSTHFNDVLYKGSELTITTQSEKPNSKKITNQNKELFVHILAGSVTIQSLNGKEITFFRGDFFVLPKGFSGIWKNTQSNLLRTLVISKSNNL